MTLALALARARSLLLLLLVLLSLVACGSKGASEPGGSGTGNRCAKGEYFLPGCSDEPGIVAGCYERCAGAAATCGAGTACTTAHVMPACALADGDVQCDACGEDVQLCLPSATD
jgi:hypothetical protein